MVLFLRFYIQTYLELLVESFNVVLDPLDELGLVLPDGSTDMWPHKQGVEAREDSEHLVGVLGRAELIPQTGSDPRFYTVNALFISETQRVTPPITHMHSTLH